MTACMSMNTAACAANNGVSRCASSSVIMILMGIAAAMSILISLRLSVLVVSIIIISLIISGRKPLPET